MEYSLEQLEKLDELSLQILNKFLDEYIDKSKFIMPMTRVMALGSLSGILLGMLFHETGITAEEFVRDLGEVTPKLTKQILLAKTIGSKIDI